MIVNIDDIETGSAENLPSILRNIWTDLDELKVRVADLEPRPLPASDEAWYARLDANSSHAAQERGYLEGQIAKLEDILGNIWLYVDWRYITKQLTSEQKEMFALSVERWDKRLDPYGNLNVNRWWLD